MELKEYLPSGILKPYVKCYWLYKSSADNLPQLLVPSGYAELAVNISGGKAGTLIDGRYIKMPDIEICGHLTLPAQVLVSNGTTLLLARFYPHTSSLFFPNQITEFTNAPMDIDNVFSNEAAELYQKMMEKILVKDKIIILEKFLIQKLNRNKRNHNKLNLAKRICFHAGNDEENFNIKKLAIQYKVSERYIQKLFLEYVGISPKTLFNIKRFNKSLGLIQTSDFSLTSIAYECGYFDQAHFIKEFKKFSGITPSQFQQSLAL